MSVALKKRFSFGAWKFEEKLVLNMAIHYSLHMKVSRIMFQLFFVNEHNLTKVFQKCFVLMLWILVVCP